MQQKLICLELRLLELLSDLQPNLYSGDTCPGHEGVLWMEFLQ